MDSLVKRSNVAGWLYIVILEGRWNCFLRKLLLSIKLLV